MTCPTSGQSSRRLHNSRSDWSDLAVASLPRHDPRREYEFCVRHGRPSLGPGLQGYSKEWVRRSKASMESVLPRFNSQRMVMDYVRSYYAPARTHRENLERGCGRGAMQLAAWRQRLTAGWARVQARRVDEHVARVAADHVMKIVVALRLGTLDIRDVRVECIFGRQSAESGFVIHHSAVLRPLGLNADGEAVYSLETRPPLSGLQHYKLRVYPFHPLMRHPLESGLMMWI